MYGTRFSSEFEDFGRDFFGVSRVIEQADPKKEFSNNYLLPEGVKLIQCYQDVNGKWIPSLEENPLGSLEKEIISE